nr:immunoglobulin heavy chain junction region [Mus musculus]
CTRSTMITAYFDYW